MTRYKATRKPAMACAVLLGVTAASAQSAPPAKTALPTENVTVSGTKSREVVRGFVDSFASHTETIGKIARWETGICPIVAGLPPDFATFVTQRVKEVAAKVGAPVSTNKTCRRNIEIVFTRTPQALLDNVKKDQEDFLGYHDSAEQRDRLATVTHPIQAWYATATQDLNGVLQMDVSSTRMRGPGLRVELPCDMMRTGQGPKGGLCVQYLPYRKYNFNGSRLDNGLRSDLYNIIIVVDIAKTGQYELDTVSDYIAMLALAQPSSLDKCPSLPSIMSLQARDCQDRAGRLTDPDISFLEGTYKMNPEMNAGIQESQIAERMVKALSQDQK